VDPIEEQEGLVAAGLREERLRVEARGPLLGRDAQDGGRVGALDALASRPEELAGRSWRRSRAARRRPGCAAS
jgi:hypothetical protein